jgi:hypothetical protein
MVGLRSNGQLPRVRGRTRTTSDPSLSSDPPEEEDNPVAGSEKGGDMVTRLWKRLVRTGRRTAWTRSGRAESVGGTCLCARHRRGRRRAEPQGEQPRRGCGRGSPSRASWLSAARMPLVCGWHLLHEWSENECEDGAVAPRFGHRGCFTSSSFSPPTVIYLCRAAMTMGHCTGSRDVVVAGVPRPGKNSS